MVQVFAIFRNEINPIINYLRQSNVKLIITPEQLCLIIQLIKTIKLNKSPTMSHLLPQ